MKPAKARFVAGAGAHSAGAIIEVDGGEEFVRTALDTVSFDLKVDRRIVRFSKERAGQEPHETDPVTAEDLRVLRAMGLDHSTGFEWAMKRDLTGTDLIVGRAVVRDESFNRHYSFSAFCSERVFRELSLVVHRSDVNRCAIFHIGEDKESGRKEEIGVEIRVDDPSFAALLTHVEEGCWRIILDVRLDSRKFFAVGTHFYNDGRMIKLLGHPKRQLENPEDLPEHFQNKYLQNNRFSLSFERDVGVPMQGSGDAADLRTPESPPGPSLAEAQQVAQLLRILSETRQSIRLGVIIIALAIVASQWLT